MADDSSIPSAVRNGRCPRHGNEMVVVFDLAGRAIVERYSHTPILRCPVCVGLWRARLQKALRCSRQGRHISEAEVRAP